MRVGIPSQVIGRLSANSNVWPVAMRIMRPRTYGPPGLGQLHGEGVRVTDPKTSEIDTIQPSM